ncbi:LOW QUALITY PROTEIN: uncharacterized protein [Panulirus ornatus]|uniref:LOW QUALITY PROTEIN: uncharacterized protein n=1 Tax=Panulirus ornatus TaxID=150431 RepID=UPI003A89B139
MMGGRRAAVLLLLLLSAVASVMIPLAAAQNPQGTTAVQQNPGLLERLMTQYVYPIRDYDWRAMIRNLIDNVMNYISPTTKEPKAGYGRGQARYRRRAAATAATSDPDDDLRSALVSLMEIWSSGEVGLTTTYHRGASDTTTTTEDEGTSSSPTSPSRRGPEPQGRRRATPRVPQPWPDTPPRHDPVRRKSDTAGGGGHHPTILARVAGGRRTLDPRQGRRRRRPCVLLGPLLDWGPTTNSHVTPSVAAYSWDYLGFLLVFCAVSILGSLIPLYQHIPLDLLVDHQTGTATGLAAKQEMTGMMDAQGVAYAADGHGLAYATDGHGLAYATADADGVAYAVDADGLAYAADADGLTYATDGHGLAYATDANGVAYAVDADGLAYATGGADGSAYITGQRGPVSYNIHNYVHNNNKKQQRISG